MTGEEFVETCQKALSGYRKGMDFLIDDREIWIVSCDIFNEMARNGFFQNMELEDPSVPTQFVTTFMGPEENGVRKGIALYNDPVRNLSYFNLPAIPINLPNRRGFKMIFPIRNMEARFWVIDPNEVASAISLLGKNSSKTFAWQEGRRMYLSRLYSVSDAPRIAAMLVNSGMGSVSMDADLPMDEGQIHQVRLRVLDYFLNAGKPIDTTKDAK